MLFLADFHIHSNFSDGALSIPEIVDYYGIRSFGAIAVTDPLCENTGVWGKISVHLGNTVTAATSPLYRAILKTEAERAWDQYRMLLIPESELMPYPLPYFGTFIKPRHITGWKMAFRCEKKREALFEAIRNQEFQFQFYREGKAHGSLLNMVRTALGIGGGGESMGNMVRA